MVFKGGHNCVQFSEPHFFIPLPLPTFPVVTKPELWLGLGLGLKEVHLYIEDVEIDSTAPHPSSWDHLTKPPKKEVKKGPDRCNKLLGSILVGIRAWYQYDAEVRV